jgi:hypothetical protein
MKNPNANQLALTLFAADSLDLVSRFPWQETKKAKGMTVTSGLKCAELSENLSRVGLLVKMYLESCQLPLTTFARTWSMKVTKSGYLIMKLRLSERSTGEKESFLWPTPQAFDAKATENWQPGSEWDRKKKYHTLPKAVQMFPTPRANKPEGYSSDRYSLTLLQAITGEEKPLGGQLNPNWVEWLMGFPIGWTDLSA